MQLFQSQRSYRGHALSSGAKCSLSQLDMRWQKAGVCAKKFHFLKSTHTHSSLRCKKRDIETHKNSPAITHANRHMWCTSTCIHTHTLTQTHRNTHTHTHTHARTHTHAHVHTHTRTYTHTHTRARIHTQTIKQVPSPVQKHANLDVMTVYCLFTIDLAKMWGKFIRCSQVDFPDYFFQIIITQAVLMKHSNDGMLQSLYSLPFPNWLLQAAAWCCGLMGPLHAVHGVWLSLLLSASGGSCHNANTHSLYFPKGYFHPWHCSTKARDLWIFMLLLLLLLLLLCLSLTLLMSLLL